MSSLIDETLAKVDAIHEKKRRFRSRVMPHFDCVVSVVAPHTVDPVQREAIIATTDG